MPKDANSPAFPTTIDNGCGEGMSLRDYFAAQALVGSVMTIDVADKLAQRAYQIADAMLKARE